MEVAQEDRCDVELDVGRQVMDGVSKGSYRVDELVNALPSHISRIQDSHENDSVSGSVSCDGTCQ